MAATIKSLFNPERLRWEYETVPEVIPGGGGEVLIASDVHVLEIHLNASAAATVTINDGNGLPIVPATLPMSAKTEYIQEFTGRLCPLGMSWTSSDGASIVGYIRWY